MLKCGIIVEDLLLLHALKKITEALVEDLDDLLADARTHLLQVVNDGVHYVEVVVVHYLEALDGCPARAHTFRDQLYVPQQLVLLPVRHILASLHPEPVGVGGLIT